MRAPITVSVLLFFAAASAFSATYYVAPDGLDTNPGTTNSPFATITRAQAAASFGDTVYLRGGTYDLDNSHLTATNAPWAIVNNLNKNGISYLAFPGDDRPVFDFSAVQPAGFRVTAFYVTADDCVFKGFDVVGVQVTIAGSHTQSECFRVHGGDRNRFEQLAMHDGMGIGWYLTRGADNLVLNCDAYNNRGLDSGSIGNIDGFGAHPNQTGGTGNVFRGCRAWFNSDDGFDLINADAAATIENCWAFYNGYFTNFVSSGGDGHGFKSGGYGRNGSAFPTPVPRHVTQFCLAVRNRVSGFYANHHTGGLDWISNTAYANNVNYNMLCTLSDNLTDVPGYDHYMKNNLGYDARSGNEVTNLGPSNDVSYNYFTLPVTVSAGDFVSLDEALLTQPRQPDGSLPDIGTLHLVGGSDLVNAGTDVGFPYAGSAPDLGAFEHVPISALRFEGIDPLPAGGVQVAFSGEPGEGYELRWTPDAAAWPPLSWDLLSTGILTASATTFDDLQATGHSMRIYGVHYPVEPIVLTPDADTYLRYGHDEGKNYGTSTTLDTRQNDSAPREYFAYVRFDLTSVSGTITGSTFSVTKAGGDTLVNGRFRVLGLDNVSGNTPQDWIETGLTFNALGDEADPSLIYPGPAAGESPFDPTRVTDFEEGTPGITETISGGNMIGSISGSALADWLEARRNDGGLATLIIDFPAHGNTTDDKSVSYASRENTTVAVPALELNYIPPL